MQAHDHRSEQREREPAHTAAHSHTQGAAPRNRGRWVFFGFLAIAAFLLITEHRAHLLGFLPWLILLACPLMHFFMHGSHGHGGHGDHNRARPDDSGKGENR